MRFGATAIATAIALLFVGSPAPLVSSSAEAQERARTRITIQPRSYLDPGTTVKEGTARYHNYVSPPQMRYPSYGPGSPFGPSNQGLFAAGDGRWPLPGLFDIPGY